MKGHHLRRLTVVMVLLLLCAGACGPSGEERGGDGQVADRSEGTGATNVAESPDTTIGAPVVSLSESQDSASAATEPESGGASTWQTEAEATSISGEDVTNELVLPVTVVDETGASVTVESIERIIPLDGDIAEIVFALGLGDQVVAVDLSATFPPEAEDLPLVGYQRALSTEPIAAFEPTVLLATALAGPPETLDELRRLGFPLIFIPSVPTSRGPGMKIRAVATALGAPTRGEALAEEVEGAIADATVTEECPQDCPRVLMLYVRGTAAQLVFGESSPTRWLIEAAGGLDVSRQIGVVEPTPISAEAIIVAAPDVLITTEVGLETVGGIEGLLEIPGLAGTPAGRHGRVLTYDAQLLLGNGPRVGALIGRLADDLKAISERRKE